MRTARRHRRVAREFQIWLQENDKAPLRRKVKTFDAIADAAYEIEALNESVSPSRPDGQSQQKSAHAA